jgi:cytochrome P450
VDGSEEKVDMLARHAVQDPYPLYRKLRDEGTVRRHVVKSFSAAVSAWLITDYDQAKTLLMDPRLGKDARELPRITAKHAVNLDGPVFQVPPSMLFSDPPDHTRLRKSLTKAFTVRRVEELRPWIIDYCRDLADAIVPGQVFDAVETLALRLPVAVIGSMLGIPEDSFDDFARNVRVIASIDATNEEKQAAVAAEFAEIAKLVAVKRETPSDDLTSALIPEMDAGNLSETELQMTILLLINAGFETTANLISSALMLLATHPDQRARLAGNLSEVPRAVEEVLRYESPLNLTTVRYTKEPVEVGEVTIPEDETVFISLCAANRDPANFADPDTFDSEREQIKHLAFGYGVHHCLGAPLARLEAQILLGELLTRFGTWQIAGEAQDLEWRNMIAMRGLKHLPMIMK